MSKQDDIIKGALQVIDKAMGIQDEENITRGQYMARQVYLSDIKKVIKKAVEAERERMDEREVSTTFTGNCEGDNHFWVWAGSGEIPIGYPCSCGQTGYKRPSEKGYNYCPHCGYEL